MNNRGQVLIIFVLLIPLLILFLAFVVDNLYIAYHMSKLTQINNLVLKDAVRMELTTDEIEDYIYQNDQEITIKLLVKTDNHIAITLEKRIKSIFGRIIGEEYYTIISKKEIDYQSESLHNQ